MSKHGLTARELIELLEYEDEDMLVYFAVPAGDYWGNTLAHEAERVEVTRIKWSEYHREFKLEQEDENDHEESTHLEGILIS